MTANTNLERRVAEHYASEPQLRAPDRVLDAALATIDTTKQRRGLLAPWRFTNMNAYAKVAGAAIAVIAVGAIGLWQLAGPDGPPATPSSPSPPAVVELAEIVITEATAPRGLTVYRTVRGVEALHTSGVVPMDVLGLVDAIETSFDDDEDHDGEHDDLYRTFGAVFETVPDAERAFDAAVALHESSDWWGLTAGEGPVERDPDLGLGDESVHYVQGSDYGYPEIRVYLWRVDNMLLHAVDLHPYDRPDLLESIARGMDARARRGEERRRTPDVGEGP